MKISKKISLSVMLMMAVSMVHAHDSQLQKINWNNKHEYDYSVQPAKTGHDSHERLLSDVTSNNYFTVGKTRTRVTEVTENGKKFQRKETWVTKNAPMNWTNISLSTGAAALAVGGAVAYAYGIGLDDIKNALTMGTITPQEANEAVAKAEEIAKSENSEAPIVAKIMESKLDQANQGALHAEDYFAPTPDLTFAEALRFGLAAFQSPGAQAIADARRRAEIFQNLSPQEQEKVRNELEARRKLADEENAAAEARFNSFVMKPLLKDKKLWEAMPNDDVNPYFDEDTQGLTTDELMKINPVTAAITVPVATGTGLVGGLVGGIGGGYRGLGNGMRVGYNKGYEQAGMLGGIAGGAAGGMVGVPLGIIEGSVHGASKAAAITAEAVGEHVSTAVGHGPADTSVNYSDELINS